MFNGMSGLTSLDVSSFDTSNVTNMSNVFQNCSSLTTIYVGNNWSVNNVSESFNMFRYCLNLVGGAGTTYNSSHTNKEYARVDCLGEHSGYLTYKGSIGDNVTYCSSIGYDYSPNVH